MLAQWDKTGYAAYSLNGYFSEFHKITLSLEALDGWKKRLAGISISLGKDVGAFDGADGLIRIYHSRWDGIDLEFRDIEPRGWEPLLEFMRDLRRQIIPVETFSPTNIDSEF